MDFKKIHKMSSSIPMKLRSSVGYLSQPSLSLSALISSRLISARPRPSDLNRSVERSGVPFCARLRFLN